jgi:flagellar basal-body rod protein FlgG
MPYNFGFADAVHGSLVEERRMELISNNLANVSTPGYKADRLLFNDIMGRRVYTDLSQGSLEQTGNKLDVAITGDGFFQVDTDNGMRLTRNGSFRMRADGTVVTGSGHTVLGEGGAPLVLNPQGQPVHITEEGVVFQGAELVGAISVVEAADPNALEKEGLGLFAARGGGAPATGRADDYALAQGHLEMANSQVVREMVGMIDTFRGFESYQKAIHIMQQIDTKAATQVGRVA